MSAFKRAAILTASLAIVGAVTAACDSYGTSASAPAPAATTASAPATAGGGANSGSSGNTGSAVGTAALTTVTSSSLGQIVTNASGLTLYRFDKDTNKPPTSNCSGQCAAEWPPAAVGDSVTLNGVDKSLVGTITRADGTKQLTLNGWPLYTYAGDSQPGDTNGQGVGGTWYAVTPTGGKAKTTGTGTANNGTGNGYGNNTTSGIGNGNGYGNGYGNSSTGTSGSSSSSSW
jgi:predicted lipoprotein with Yx(FWY)xxD motif